MKIYKHSIPCGLCLVHQKWKLRSACLERERESDDLDDVGGWQSPGTF